MVIKRDFLYTPAGEDRRLHIYLPDAYEQSDERYPVMYFLDGHNLFFDADATYGTCWGLKEFLDCWEKPMIVVGIECGHAKNQRLREYSPYTSNQGFMKGIRGIGDATFRWIIDELKPMIDREYRTWRNRQCTAIAGSSMGGLMAWYGVTKYNAYFSKAACVSSAFGICMKKVETELKKSHIDADTRVFLSWGSQEGYDMSTTAKNNAFVGRYLESQGAAVEVFCQVDGRHCEADWAKQVKDFMDFLWMR